jgi:predicted nucleic acid-binding protein
MLIYLDSNIVIYFIEQPPNFGPRALARIAIIRSNKDRMAVSHLTRMECRVRPIALGDALTLGHFDAFFASADVQVFGLTAAVCDRATVIRAQHRYRTADALHLAVAVEAGCDVFLTQDARLSGFPGITVEVLP